MSFPNCYDNTSLNSELCNSLKTVRFCTQYRYVLGKTVKYSAFEFISANVKAAFDNFTLLRKLFLHIHSSMNFRLFYTFAAAFILIYIAAGAFGNLTL